MKTIEEFISENEEQTRDFAASCISIFKPGDIVELSGNLGAGKTFFVKSFCELKNIPNANSPSFAIVNEYAGKEKIYHFDFYRIKKNEELIEIGFYDYINDESAITFIEWGDLFEELLPLSRYVIKFGLLDNTKRKISLLKYE
ncbi:MAG: tRNA (adenosine(37)-N6)-threonylcarbamoyltransferase complex ATPase subunit type 1 TsaE [Melioribacteraceae bacterium]|nr:tRNA (adenosine(37)-N6)-threonylcarbamoyltransferase complex ATPase subunit type 1 TsaE [Melioribacteraceae bacterium]